MHDATRFAACLAILLENSKLHCMYLVYDVIVSGGPNPLPRASYITSNQILKINA